jgi:DNA-binding XRE family transcriptional regulator
MSQIESGISYPAPNIANKITDVLGKEFDEIFFLKDTQNIEGAQLIEGAV